MLSDRRGSEPKPIPLPSEMEATEEALEGALSIEDELRRAFGPINP